MHRQRKIGLDSAIAPARDLAPRLLEVLYSTVNSAIMPRMSWRMPSGMSTKQTAV